MSHDESSWYVKASFGAEWGPMSAATLQQMAAEGAFASDDAARYGADGSWQSVAAVLDTLRSNNVSEPASALDDAAPELNSEFIGDMTTEPTSYADHSGTKPIRRSSLPGWTNYWTRGSHNEAPAPEKPPLVLASELLTNTVGSFTANADSLVPHEPAGSKTEFVATGSSAKRDSHEADPDGRFDELNAWKQERTERLDRLLKIVADREAASAREAEAAKSLAAESCPNPIHPEQGRGLEMEGEPNASQSIASESNKLPRPAVKRPEKWEETLARWRRSLPDWRFALPMLFLPWLIWHYWPVSQGNIAETYRSMYQDLRRLRDLPQNKTGMEEFVARSQTTLDEILPKLKQRSTSQDPDTQLLLWIGRDCLKPMLKSPRLRNSKHEDMLKKLLAQWDSTHHIERVAESPDPGAEPLPVSSSATPLGFGSSSTSESAEPVEIELPPPSSKTTTKPPPAEIDDPN